MVLTLFKSLISGTGKTESNHKEEKKIVECRQTDYNIYNQGFP